MEGPTMENFLKTKNKDLEFLPGLMAGSILETGIKENSMELENMHLLMERQKLGNGFKEKGLIGLLKRKSKENKYLLLKSSNLLLIYEINIKIFMYKFYIDKLYIQIFLLKILFN